MNEEHDRAWSDLARRVRQGERHVIGGADAERLLRELSDEAISDADVTAIVQAVVSGRPLGERSREEAAPAIDDAVDTVPESIEEDVLQLNRNKGAEDEEAESTLDELRREALKDDDEEDQSQ